jgi:N12 class adenine-specific DNA methylase
MGERKLLVVTGWLIPEASGKPNKLIEAEIKEELETMTPSVISYLQKIEKVRVSSSRRDINRLIKNKIFKLRKEIDKIKDEKRKQLLISEFNSMLTDIIPLFPTDAHLFKNYSFAINEDERKRQAKQPLYLVRYE